MILGVDEGKPDGATYHLLTSETSGGQVTGYPDAHARTDAITRYVSGFDGDLMASTTNTATTLELANLHGDVAATLDPSTPGPVTLHDYDEFGGSNGSEARYGWLGGNQRYADQEEAVLLMGSGCTTR